MMDSDTRIHLLDNEIDLVNDEASTKHDKAGEKRKRKETSKWWPFFERVTDESGQRKAKCKAYGHVQNAPSNYGANNLKKHVMRCSKAKDPSSSSTPTSSHVRDTLDANENLSNEDKEVMEEYLTLGSDVVMTDEESQLQLYLEEPRPQWTENFDILEFWKGYQYRYPEVAVFACDILSISISMVASESAFSVGGRVIDRFRSTLKPDYVEALICTRDWLFGESAINATIKLDELNEDLTNLSISEMVESTGTISSAME